LSTQIIGAEAVGFGPGSGLVRRDPYLFRTND